jgi:hypothetical protein
MNLFGKILVALNLVMSLVFMGFAIAVYSTHQNWRDQITAPNTGLNARLETAFKVNHDLNEHIKFLTAFINQERRLRDARLALLETEKQNFNAKLKDATDAVAAITADKNATTAAIQALTTDVGTKTAQNDSLAKEVERVKGEREDYYKTILRLTDELGRYGAEVEKLKYAQSEIISDNAKFKAVLAAHQIDPNAPIPHSAPPKVDGVVKEAQNDFVVISLGSDDGLSRGHMLEVFRPGPTPNASKYLGRIEITETYADVSVGKIIPQFRRGNIEKDDRVATKLN